ncbi:MAG: DegQ family serine endoprotease [Porticoccaceae bacterium]|nr:DegQ family serine endoprotease [Porticoccaceae bacterium]MBT7257623.1 DegQ family serine endoprotease [Porticoccaceae bacterium]MDA9565863.1 DegQ family serine endoprotease [Porticoccaceae bacterium]MDB2554269.1 DegQ family serine endoprotease [Porticoccaceae bacterium]MDG1446742.1 DegQ family serine endoprotease [Porticoccaceae bacterium]
MLKKLIFVTTILFFSVSSAYGQLPDFADLVEEVAPAVVKINTVTKNRKQQTQQNMQGQLPEIFRELLEQRNRPQPPARQARSMGSGFVISEDGYLLTNHHVIDQADEIQVLFSDRREYSAKVIGSDRRSDLALLKIEAKNLPTIKFADVDSLRAGEWVLAIGSPFGLDYSVAAGIVSAIGRSIPTEKGENYVPFIQTDVAINPGNSGGPLFNLKGEVVGINSQIYSRSGGSIGLSFSIPTSVALSVVDQLKKNGKVQRGWLGVVMQDVNKALAESLELGKPQGALINAVEPDGPADRGGINPGDVIVRFDGEDIVDSGDLPHVVGSTAPGTKAKVEIYREGKRKTLNVVVGALDKDGPAVADKNNGNDRLGLMVEELDDQERRQLRLRGGILVADVAANSAAANAGLREGDIIVQLGYSRIDDLDEYLQVIEELPESTPIAIRFYRQGRAIFRTIQID